MVCPIHGAHPGLAPGQARAQVRQPREQALHQRAPGPGVGRVLHRGRGPRQCQLVRNISARSPPRLDYARTHAVVAVGAAVAVAVAVVLVLVLVLGYCCCCLIPQESIEGFIGQPLATATVHVTRSAVSKQRDSFSSFF